ncbi:hypothetical protein FHS85_004477 [Rhodoligotrophos appendicifer]|uniref:hypothetical protein n=1 Tax=Rhodoligotrophos appendicifer TaxID=987056 RepID=UPI0011870F45|nr:hypothetical protein [Rhodoligotrophos appendicifer]
MMRNNTRLPAHKFHASRNPQTREVVAGVHEGDPGRKFFHQQTGIENGHQQVFDGRLAAKVCGGEVTVEK